MSCKPKPTDNEMAFTLSPVEAPMELLPLPSSSGTSSGEMPQLLAVPPTQNLPSGKDKFRSLVNKVINRRRACIAIQEVVSRSHSLDQGADPRNPRSELRFGSRVTKCTIEVTHYSEAEEDCKTITYDNAGLVGLLKGDSLAELQGGRVRWINVAGISWDVVKELAIRFNLHPLSVEDVMTDTHDKSFKIDYYQQHLFAQLTSFKLPQKGARNVKAAVKKLRENSSGHYYFTGRAKEHHSQRRSPPRSNTVVPTIQTSDADAILRTPIEPPRSLKSRSSTISELGRSAFSVVHPTLTPRGKISMVEDAVQTLKLQSGTLDVDTTRLFVFLLKDGKSDITTLRNIITIHQSGTLYGSELTERLNDQPQSLLRTLPDASMLFHGHLDLIGDNLLAIVDEYQLMILELERGILLKPTLVAVQSLHLISGDIRLLHMAIKPLQRIIYRLRRYDRDRYKAVAPVGANTAMGFMCEESLVYLSDILDHVRFIILSLDGQTLITKELIDYTFNMTSYDSRDVMRILLIVTVIFLPLMFIAQYFGMNFDPMPSVNNHSEALYWEVASPVLFVLLLVCQLHPGLLKSDHNLSTGALNMPRSNSDADENDSLTSDDEAVGPTVGHVDLQNMQSAPAAPAGGPNVDEAGGGSSLLEPPTRPTPITKFQSSVNKVIAMNRAQSALLDIAPGTEPGADPRKSATVELYGQIKANCKIEMCEYGPSRARFTDYDNKSFIKWLNSNEATAKREVWNKVRWINIAGVSWDVIGALALRYDLHPLAIEDVLHGRKNARSKADYYTRHLFIHVLTHKLGRQEDESGDSDDETTEEPLSLRTSGTSSTVVDRKGFYEPGDDGMDHSRKGRGGWLTRRKSLRYTGSNGPNGKKGSGWHGDLEHGARAGDNTRKRSRLTTLLAARQAKDKYHDVILKMERSILLKPNMKTVRGLHIISGDLTLHKRTLGPLSQLVYGLRRYDLDRCKARSAGREGEVVGFLSHQAKVYLADVHDHVEYIMSSLDMFTSIAENLITYTFNIVSYETNQVMRGLTIATVIFFPLTFLTGYFGMNFATMPSVQDHSETMFWEIAAPVMVVVIVAFLFPDIQKLAHLIKKRMATRKYDY
ncbi:hypothetical protein FRC11_011415 [Ceratobasidium sp. 423]|nr:hypothetical protein FRC11_011415 [Ceratobasidium sp. 423]